MKKVFWIRTSYLNFLIGISDDRYTHIDCHIDEYTHIDIHVQLTIAAKARDILSRRPPALNYILPKIQLAFTFAFAYREGLCLTPQFSKYQVEQVRSFGGVDTEG